MEKERKITAPDGCEIEKVEIVDGVAVITFREKERQLPKSWEEFCEMFPVKGEEFYFNQAGGLGSISNCKRASITDNDLFPDRATAESILALMQLIQLRNAYNGDWVPDWTKYNEDKYVIDVQQGYFYADLYNFSMSLLYFKTAELRDEFLRYFRPLIEKLKPLYGIEEGGKEC